MVLLRLWGPFQPGIVDERRRLCKSDRAARSLPERAVRGESVYAYEGTHEIHTLVPGRALTGESAF
ncbi:MAG: hypothetical protein DHS20C21_11150 [Gemmatimonadota bacterium]|nr:MAG: hypothetical protein DHS20C21_11150 [Gemmatimonadota bacterium]